MRRTLLWAFVVMALLLLALPAFFLQERMEPGPPVGVEIVNESQETIWVAAEPSDGLVLELDPGESDTTCFLRANEVHVHQMDPDGGSQLGPGFTLQSGGVDFCDGMYGWDGSTLSLIE